MSEPVPKRVYLLLGLGVVAGSQSGNIVRLAEASAAAISTWRLLLATLLLWPLSWRQMADLARLSHAERALVVLSGVVLGLHFIAWIAAVQLTTVANAAILFAVNPVTTAVGAALFFGERPTVRLLLAIAFGLGGMLAIGAEGLSLAEEHLWGDALALLSALLFTIYFLVGKRLRRTMRTGAYVTAVYGIAGLTSFAWMLIQRDPIVDYSAITWFAFLLLALFPTMAGHTSVNYALRYIDASRLSLATLVEPLLAGIVAWFAWGEEFTVATTVGYLLICASVVVVISDWRQVSSAKA